MNTSTNRSGFSYGQFSVLRRYSDFAWFHDQLCFLFPGVIVPPLPEKQAVGRFGSEFVESRRRALEKFIDRVLKHKDLLNCELLITFLEADDVSLSAAKDRSKQDKEKKSTTMKSWFDSKVNQLTVQPGQVQMDVTPADAKVNEISEYVTKIENQVVNLSKNANTLIRRHREVASALRDFGQSYTFLGQAEGHSLGSALIQVGTTSEELAVLSADAVESAIIQFEEPVQEYLRALQSVKAAIQRRDAKKSAYYNAIIDLEAKTSAYNKAAGVPGKEETANQKQQAVERAQTALDNAKLEYEDVSRILINEFDAFKTQKAEELRDMSILFVTIQNDLANKSEAAWSELLRKLRSTDLPSSPGGATLPSTYSYAHTEDRGPPPRVPQNPFAPSAFRDEDGEMIGV